MTVLQRRLDEVSMFDLLHLRYSATNPGNGPRYICAEHVRSSAGFDARRTCDFMAMDLWPSSRLALHGHEVKVSRSDWLRELKDPAKSAEFMQHCDRWWLVCPPRVAKMEELPSGWGMLSTRGDGTLLRVVRPAPLLRPERPDLFNPGPPVLPKTLVAALLRATARTARSRP